MEKLLIFVKHKLRVLWTIIDWGNGLIFSVVFKKKLNRVLPDVFSRFSDSPYDFKKLTSIDVPDLYALINNQPQEDLRYFNPHKFDIRSLHRQNKKPAFLMMGVYDRDLLVGYFFLRFFFNGKCFVGRLIDSNYRGRGIGLSMNNIMYETAWRMDFRCLSTISKNNVSVMKAHSRNRSMKILKELQNDYLLVEFIRGTNDTEKDI